MIWMKSQFQEFEDEDFKRMEAALYKFIEKEMTLVCYVDDLILFAENPSSIDGLKRNWPRNSKLRT